MQENTPALQMPLALQEFIDQTIEVLVQAAHRAATLPENTVQVWPGGQTFSSIQAAIDSITNASPAQRYQVAVGCGTYKEALTLKDHVFIAGADIFRTMLVSPFTTPARALVRPASDSGISGLTLVITGSGDPKSSIGLGMSGEGYCHIRGVEMLVGDDNNPDDAPRAIANTDELYNGTLVLSMSYLKLKGNDNSIGVGVDLTGEPGISSPAIWGLSCDIQVHSKSTNIGVRTSGGATAILIEAKVDASSWALQNSDGRSPITAYLSKINGPVSEGVTILPKG